MLTRILSVSLTSSMEEQGRRGSGSAVLCLGDAKDGVQWAGEDTRPTKPRAKVTATYSGL